MQDVNAVAELWYRARAAQYGADLATPTAASLADHLREAYAQGREIAVYDIENVIAAFMIVDPGAAHVQQLFVDVPWQGQGIGKAMLDSLKVRFPHGWSLNVLVINRKAIAFYERYGLVRVDAGVSPVTSLPRVAYVWRRPAV